METLIITAIILMVVAGGLAIYLMAITARDVERDIAASIEKHITTLRRK